jgi:phosphatidylglycerol---prolipoprotein diacylglyceryl transferase
MNHLAYLIWNASPDLGFSFGGLAPRWYGLLFASGFFFGQLIMTRIFRTEGKPERDLDAMMLYMIVSTVLGARLGHCLFYQPDYYLANPLEILKVWEGGLASHGATAGILLGLWLYSRSRRATGQTYLWVLDRIVIVVALGGCLIRLGNFINGEIIGKPTSAPVGVVFVNWLEQALEARNQSGGLSGFEGMEVRPGSGADTVVGGITYVPLEVSLQFGPQAQQNQNYSYLYAAMGSILTRGEVSEHFKSFGPVQFNTPNMSEFKVYGIPRHPAQLYEAISCFLLFLLLYWLWHQHKAATPHGRIFGLFVVILFGLRFFYEFLKENQVAFEDDLALNQGQNLSIPMILVGVVVLARSFRKPAA